LLLFSLSAMRDCFARTVFTGVDLRTTMVDESALVRQATRSRRAMARGTPSYWSVGACWAMAEADHAGRVYRAEDEEAVPVFQPLPHLTSSDVADLLQLARVRILRFPKRQGAIVETGRLFGTGERG
jgi:hypothetical protein